MSQRRHAVRPVCPKRLSLLVAQAMLLWMAGPASQAGVITLTGNYWSDPWDAAPFPGGDIVRPDVHLSIGTGGEGSFSLTNQAYANLRSLAYAVSNNGVSGSSNSVIDGFSTLRLSGSEGRLSVGGFGTAALTLSGGATIDASSNVENCRAQNVWCGANIGSAAGSEGTLTLTGAGTTASFLHGLDLAHAYRDVYGSIAGGSSTGRVNVLDGATLFSEYSYSSDSVLTDWQTPGTESSHASILINGAGSAWTIGNLGSDRAPVLSLGYGTRASATLDIENGGTLSIQDSAPGAYSSLTLGGNGAHVVANVSGGGRLLLDTSGAGDSHLTIGFDGAFGQLNIFNGGQLIGGQFSDVGLNGGTGELRIDGSTSSATFNHASFLNIGNAGSGNLTITGGASASAGVLNVGLQQGDGTVLLSGAGSRLTLSKTDNHRFNVENGSMTVADGAVLDATAEALTCLNVWCGNVIGTYAGRQASLNVTGSGSRVSLLNSLDVGGAWAEIGDNYINGTPGGISNASLRVLNGGKVESQYATVGAGPNGPSATGTEQSYASVLLQGAGSNWTVSGNPLNNSNAWFATNAGGSDGVGSSVDLRILGGAELTMGSAGVDRAILTLGWQNGSTTATVSGAGSRINFASEYNELTVGANQAIGALNVTRGGRIEHLTNFLVGANDGNGTAVFDGAGSGASSGGGEYAGIGVGVWGGTGRLQVSNGAVIDFRNERIPYLDIGVSYTDGIGSGTLTISGAGSQLLLGSQAAPGDGYISNPWSTIGLRGLGQVTVQKGGLLSLAGYTPAERGGLTGMHLGVAMNGDAGSAIATVTGAGSLLQVAGVNAVISAGIGTLGSAQLNVLNGGRIETTALNLGLEGGQSRLLADAGTVALSGQWSDGAGAALRLGRDAGSLGTVQLRNGAAVTISNHGDGGALLQVGDGGSGILRADSGSSITLDAGPGNAQVEINGVSNAVLNASSLSAAGGNVYIGGRSGDSATLKLENNATLNAAYVGVGTRYGTDGGNATLIVNGSTVTADTLEIGAHGYVGGSGTLVANIINRGVFNPGNSPGTLVVDGNFINGLGGRLVLEVEADGAGGYNIDHLLFKNGAALDFSDLKISFHFLGGTDPNAFKASGLFDIDNFIDYEGSGDIAHSLYAGASFAAESDGYTITEFRFSADSGATFNAAPVPEPGTYAMLLAGLGLIGLARRSKKSDKKTTKHSFFVGIKLS